MIIDRYTKVVLTVIAGCLLFNIVRDTTFIRQAFAQSGPVHVVVDQVASYAFQYAGPLGVNYENGCKE
jgi:hypothetical protein